MPLGSPLPLHVLYICAWLHVLGFPRFDMFRTIKLAQFLVHLQNLEGGLVTFSM
jgi:hypothetical protein